MTELELKKTANEVRKNIVTAVDPAHSGHPAAVPNPAGFTAKIAGPAKALCQCQGCLRLPYWG